MTAAAPPASPPGVVPRLLAQLLVASLLLLGLACWAPHPAAADEPGPPLAVTITSQTPLTETLASTLAASPTMPRPAGATARITG